MLFAFRNPWFTGKLAGSKSTTAFRRGSDIEHPAGNPVWDQIKGLLAELQKSLPPGTSLPPMPPGLGGPKAPGQAGNAPPAAPGFTTTFHWSGRATVTSTVTTTPPSVSMRPIGGKVCSFGHQRLMLAR